MTILAGYAPGKVNASVVALAGWLARSRGEDVVAVSVTPTGWPTPHIAGSDREFAAWARREGDSIADEAVADFQAGAPATSVQARAVPGRSVPATLLTEAVATRASMVVVGSGSNGAWGRISLSSTADRLLHSSPVPIALAPRGYRADTGTSVTRVTCALRGDGESRTALELAAQLSVEYGALLRVVTFGVRGRTMHPPEVRGEDLVLAEFVDHAIAAQAAAVAGLGPHGSPLEYALVFTGRTWRTRSSRRTGTRETCLCSAHRVPASCPRCSSARMPLASFGIHRSRCWWCHDPAARG